MRALLLGLAAATMLAAAVPVSTASAQGVRVEGPGVGVRIGEPDRWREDRWSERRHYRDRATFGEGCRSVSVKKRLPDGSVVVRRRSTC
jgi:hypothetical protein